MQKKNETWKENNNISKTYVWKKNKRKQAKKVTNSEMATKQSYAHEWRVVNGHLCSHLMPSAMPALLQNTSFSF